MQDQGPARSQALQALRARVRYFLDIDMDGWSANISVTVETRRPRVPLLFSRFFTLFSFLVRIWAQIHGVLALQMGILHCECFGVLISPKI